MKGEKEGVIKVAYSKAKEGGGLPSGGGEEEERKRKRSAKLRGWATMKNRKWR